VDNESLSERTQALGEEIMAWQQDVTRRIPRLRPWPSDAPVTTERIELELAVDQKATAHVAEAIAHYENLYLPRAKECYNELVRAGLTDDPKRRRIVESPQDLDGIRKSAQIIWTMAYIELPRLSSD
jgi:hypothetical protein